MSAIRLGLISDTHGLLRPQAVAALRGVDGIVHAGDIGNAGILEELARIAPVAAVRGNNDREAWASAIPDTLTFEAGGVRVHVLHDIKELDRKPAQAHGVVISGHSHKPLIDARDGVLFINPGSAGPRRFTLPVSVALLDIRAGKPSARIVLLEV